MHWNMDALSFVFLFHDLSIKLKASFSSIGCSLKGHLNVKKDITKFGEKIIFIGSNIRKGNFIYI